MISEEKKYRFLFAGGGTGGHLFPVVSVAEKIRELIPESRILFIGTKNKIESRVVPQYGFEFKSIWISGFARKFTLQNLLFPVKMITSSVQSLLICMRFKPRVAIGSGAYVAGPAIWGASVLGAKVILMESNSYPGITNRLLEKKADEIHITFENSAKYFRDKNKLKLSGNPVRTSLKKIPRAEALTKFNLREDKKTLLVLGGSLGARIINQNIAGLVQSLEEKGYQIIWQAGEYYFEEYKSYNSANVVVKPFIDDMSAAYSSADLVVARAGATTISESALLGLPVLFIPSSNVAADHQYKNAKSLIESNAAELLRDEELPGKLLTKMISLLNDDERRSTLSINIKKFSHVNAAEVIAKSAIKMAEEI